MNFPILELADGGDTKDLVEARHFFVNVFKGPIGFIHGVVMYDVARKNTSTKLSDFHAFMELD